MTATLREEWIKWGWLTHLCLFQDLEVHLETLPAFPSSLPPFSFVSSPQVPARSYNIHWLETQLLKLPRDLSLRLFYNFDMTFSNLFDCSFPLLPTLHLSHSPHKSSQSRSSIHHLPWMHKLPQLGFLPICPKDHRGALHCVWTNLSLHTHWEAKNAGASRDCISGTTPLNLEAKTLVSWAPGWLHDASKNWEVWDHANSESNVHFSTPTLFT